MKINTNIKAKVKGANWEKKIFKEIEGNTQNIMLLIGRGCWQHYIFPQVDVACYNKKNKTLYLFEIKTGNAFKKKQLKRLSDFASFLGVLWNLPSVVECHSKREKTW